MISLRKLISLFCCFACVLLQGCSQQRGKFRVTERKSLQLSDMSGVIDVLYGESTMKTDNVPEPVPLLVVISCAPGRQFDKIVRTGGDGTMVSALNVDLGSGGPPDFGYGLIWNRTDDKLAINETEYLRSDGNVFVVFSWGGTYSVQQLDVVLKSPIEPVEIIPTVVRNLPKQLPEEVETALKDATVQDE